LSQHITKNQEEGREGVEGGGQGDKEPGVQINPAQYSEKKDEGKRKFDEKYIVGK